MNMYVSGNHCQSHVLTGHLWRHVCVDTPIPPSTPPTPGYTPPSQTRHQLCARVSRHCYSCPRRRRQTERTTLLARLAYNSENRKAFSLKKPFKKAKEVLAQLQAGAYTRPLLGST